MADGLPTPKSREQLLSEMLTEYVGLTGINDLNTGSAMTQFFDVVARSIARTSGDIFQILRDFSLDRATGEALNRIGREERIPRNTAQVSTGRVRVTDTSFQKISTKIYSGTASPNIGSSVLRVSDASNFPNTGRLYIGRGTPNIEGPINYSNVQQTGSFWEITLDSPTKKFHNIAESVVLGQGGTRNIPVSTVVIAPAAGATPDINYNVSSSALLLDGENENDNVQITAQEPGSLANAPAGAVTSFTTPPFPGAAVINVIPFTTGADLESDDAYRDRIKKERLSRGLGTALAVKNAVLGAQAPDENARVTSNEIDTTNPEQTILYIDNGEGYEEKTEGVGLEALTDSAIGGEQNFQLQTGGRQTSIAKAFLESTIESPFNINKFDRLSVLVGGIISEHIFPQSAFQSQGVATAFEIISSINDNPNLTFEATTSGDGKKVIIRAKSEDNEFIELTTPSTGVDAGPKLGFPTNEISTVLLYKNKELLNKNGRSAFVISNNQFNWSNTIADGDTLVISVDGTNAITYTFQNQDFIAEGQNNTVSAQNSLSSWVNVINKKVTGVTAQINGEQIRLISNLDSSNRASIDILSSSTLVSKGMFTETLGLSAQGNEADFEISRNTAQVKLKTPLSEGDSLTLGSEFTRAEIESTPILGGQTTIVDTAYVWLVVDDTEVEPVEVGVTADTFLNITKPGGNIVRYESTNPSAFDNINIGDYVIIWSEQLSAGNRLEGRVHDFTSTTLDLKVTTAEVTAAVIEGPIFFNEGFTVIRTEFAPQKIKIESGVYDINNIASQINEQLDNASVSIQDDEIFIFRTNTESVEGALFIADFNESAKALNLIKNSKSIGINSQLAFYESEFTDKQFPAFVHGKITTDTFADPIDSYISNVYSSENLNTLGLDPSGFICFSQPYGGPNDIQSKECVEIERYTGTTVAVENSVFYKRSRVDDRFHVLNPYDFGHNDSVVAVLNNNPTTNTFQMPLYRTAVTNTSLPTDTNNFRANDKEGGNVSFTQFFGDDFSFDNYKVLMRAKNVIDPSSSIDEDAILYRSVEWGVSGEKVKIGYFYPTAEDQPLSHIVTVGEDVKVNIFLQSGPSRTTTIDGTTEWNVSISPLNPSVDLVTYTYSGIGTAPNLNSINTGDYVSIINTGEFSQANQGAYKIDSATTTSFTVRRENGKAQTQSNVATLETNTLSFYEPLDTTALDIVDYVNDNISDYLEASIVEDGTLAGTGVIDTSTGEDSGFSYSYIELKDGKNFILSTDLDAGSGSPQFSFKKTLDLPSFDTNTSEAYAFNNGEEIKLIPITSLQLTKFLNILAVTGFTTIGTIKSTKRNTQLQLETNILGSNGSVQVVGGSGNNSSAAIQGSASSLGDQADLKTRLSILSSTAIGFHSDQWVKLTATERQKKATNINFLNSIKISNGVPLVGSSKIEIFNKGVQQRFFGRNRYFTRTRGRTFKVEKQGQFACISWDENGTEPFFLKNNIDVKDDSSSRLTIFVNETTGLVDINVDSGDMVFDEISIGDVVTIINRDNEENNGNFKILGISSDYKTIRVRNPNAINELTSGNFTITDNTAVLGSSFVVGSTTLVEGTDFNAGVDTDETALNLSAAISLLPNISSNSTGSVVNITSDVPNTTVSISTTGGGATASGSELVAPISNTGDLVFKTEVTEGDSVIIGSDFSILNQGMFKIIRRFKNSIYIDNPNIVEEEVTLSDQFLSLGSNGSTNYDVEKIDGLSKLIWGGLGDEPSLEDARPGDILILGTDFSADNQGEYHIVDSGEKLRQITKFTQSRGVDITSGEHGLINSANDVTEYYFWYNKDSGGGDPNIAGKTGIEIAITNSDTEEQIAVKKANVFNNTPYSNDFTATVDGKDVTITTVGYGNTTNSSNVNVSGDFLVETLQEGRRNFIDYINVRGISESNIVISDQLDIHREAVKFKEYEGVVPGDSFVISNDFLGQNNRGSYVVEYVLSESEIIVSGITESVDITLLNSNFNQVYIEENMRYVGYKQIDFIATNPSNLSAKSLILDTSNQFEKINEIAGVSINAIGKLDFPNEINRGVDAYKFHTGLIGESNRIVYGEPRDNTTYPGVAAAGAEIFIKAPLVRRINVSIDVRVRTGVPFSTIVEEVRNSVAALVNSNPVGQPIAISDIVSNVNAIIGVQAVAISSPQYDAQNDVIRINSGEKSLVLDVIADILVSKID